MNSRLQLKAFAKINLGLDIIGLREDGYHLVEMIMQSISLYDLVSLKKISTPGIHLSTDHPTLPTDDRNIAYRGAELIQKEFNLPGGLGIHIKKNIPLAAGLAGGSTDAAAVLKGLNELYDLGLTPSQLMKRGLSLGADVPYCILGKTALARGIGEELSELTSLPNCYILLVKPKASISTKDIYRDFDKLGDVSHPNIQKLKDGLEKRDLKLISQSLGNVLEQVTIPKVPVIDQIKKELLAHGALGALMSGSGPSIFGIFSDEIKARRAFHYLEDKKEILFREDLEIYLCHPVF